MSATINDDVFNALKKASLKRHLSYGLFSFPTSIAAFLGGLFCVFFGLYTVFFGHDKLIGGLITIMGLMSGIFGFFWLRSTIRRFTKPLINRLKENPDSFVGVSVVGIEHSLSVMLVDIPLLKKTSYPLLLYTDDGKYGFIPVPKNKVVGIYKELHRILLNAKFGESEDVTAWYIENHLYKDCNSWLQKQKKSAAFFAQA